MISDNMMKKSVAVLACGAAVFTSAMAQSLTAGTRLVDENMGRGVVAVRRDSASVGVTWRLLPSDGDGVRFNVYKNGRKICTTSKNSGTYVVDKCGVGEAAEYTVEPLTKGKEQAGKSGKYVLKADAPLGYIDIALDRPADGVTPDGQPYGYVANDAAVGDVDGDGEYEIVLKWDPTNSKDNSHEGYTGSTLLDCYRLDGKRLWRIDLGKNIRSGAHYTPFIVYDLDCDGKAEVVVRTSDGTVDGLGKVVGDATKDYRYKGDGADESERLNPLYKGRTPYRQGRILESRDYVSVFSGQTGACLASVDYIPQRGDPMGWGDDRANRSDRFLATVAYLDGKTPSVVMCRGYYTRTVLAAFDWDGKSLSSRWVFDSSDSGNAAYAGQGDHNLRVGDVDGDGSDEIVYGQCTIDHDGNGLYSTGMGHGDAMHLTQYAPDMPGLQVLGCHENKRDGTTFRDAKTGEMIWQVKDNSDVGRCLAADIDPTNWGVELWSARSGGIRNVKGDVVDAECRMPMNMAVWWDGDLLRELLDKNVVSKYMWKEKRCVPIAVFEGTEWNNGTKANPCLSADIVGDWREEVLMRTSDNSHLRLYVTDVPTDYRFTTFMSDPVYRIGVASENVGYNQPPQLGHYFGPDMTGRK